jgi:hypothetical protein
MKPKAVAIAAVVGAIALFAWQSISQTVIPWHAATMSEVADSTGAAIPAIRRLAPENGVYFSKYGALMAVRVAPDGSDRTTAAALGPMLLRQAAINLVIASALCFFVGFLTDQSPLGVGKAAALGGFAMIALREMSMVIWYGFTLGWAAVNIVDQTIGFFVAGIVVGALMQRLNGDRSVALPEGQGYRTSGGRRTVGK